METPVAGAVLIHRTNEDVLIGQVLQRRELLSFTKNGDDTNYNYSEWQNVLLEDPDDIIKKHNAPL